MTRTAQKAPRTTPHRNPGTRTSVAATAHTDDAFVIHPICGPPEGMDVRTVLIDAIAGHLDKRLGGNTELNRLEAEHLLQELFVPTPPARIAG